MAEMGPVERKLTVATAAVVFAIGLYVVIFAPLMVNEKDDGSFRITDYSFTKGAPEARLLAEEHCASLDLVSSGITKKRTYNRATEQFGTAYDFTCE